jgi:hypothetical protein
VETHFFSCADCSEKLAWLDGLDEGVVAAMQKGLFDVFFTQQSVARLERGGSVLRRYDVRPGDKVSCTASRGEDMTVVTLHAPLRKGVAVTLLVDILDHDSGQQRQLLRPAFQDQETGEVISALAGAHMRAIGHARYTLTLRYEDGSTTAGPFEMNHTPGPRD